MFTKPKTETVRVNVVPQSNVDNGIADAAALAGSALSPLLLAADDLHEAGERFELIAAIAQDQIDTLVDQMNYALEQADSNFAASRGILRVLGKES